MDHRDAATAAWRRRTRAGDAVEAWARRFPDGVVRQAVCRVEVRLAARKVVTRFVRSSGGGGGAWDG
jgi:hypothetical protein